MIQEPLDLRRILLLVRRHKIVVCLAAIVGLFAGAAYTMLRPPTLTAETWVVLAPPPKGIVIATQVVIAGSDPVLQGALRNVQPTMSLRALQGAVEITDETPTIISIKAEGKTAAQAEALANAVAGSYVDYVKHPGHLPDGPVEANIFQYANAASGTSHTSQLVAAGALGALLGAVIASLILLAAAQRDRRLRERDEIADAIAVPVLASLSVDHPADPAGWTALIERYLPGDVDAWRLRKALQYLGFADAGLRDPRSPGPFTLTVVSLSTDRRALALGPQLAVFAASRSIPTTLVIGPQQDVNATATLRAACAAPLQAPDALSVMVTDDEAAISSPNTALRVVVTVVDADAPRFRERVTRGWDDLLSGTAGSAATVLGVSAGVATAEQLARVAASAAVAGHDIIGILVADPDPADPTTGRLPQVSRPARGKRPNRMTGIQKRMRP